MSNDPLAPLSSILSGQPLVADDSFVKNEQQKKQKQVQTEQDQMSPNVDASYRSMVTTKALQSGANADNLNFASQKLGSQDYNDLCEKFVENANNKDGLYPSAAIAWNKQQDKAVADPSLKGCQPGDEVYFAPDNSNFNDGHVGLYTGNGNFVSATGAGVQEYSLADWTKSTGQQPLGYIPKG